MRKKRLNSDYGAMPNALPTMYYLSHCIFLPPSLREFSIFTFHVVLLASPGGEFSSYKSKHLAYVRHCRCEVFKTRRNIAIAEDLNSISQ